MHPHLIHINDLFKKGKGNIFADDQLTIKNIEYPLLFILFFPVEAPDMCDIVL